MKRMWDSQPFKHPATFDTLALDSKLKHAVMQKLNTFSQDGAFYAQTGRAHKMGFFLFGPPGVSAHTPASSKSSHISTGCCCRTPLIDLLLHLQSRTLFQANAPFCDIPVMSLT